MQEFLNFCLEYSEFFTCASSSFGALSNSHRQCWPGEFSILRQGAVVFCGSAGRMFLKAAHTVNNLLPESKYITSKICLSSSGTEPGNPNLFLIQVLQLAA